MFNVTYVGKYAFYRCGFTGSLTVNYPCIDDFAFYECSGFNGILTFNTPSNIISDSRYVINRIGNYSFYGCTGLKGSLDIPYQVEIIGNYAFYNCRGLNGTIKYYEEDYFNRCNLHYIGDYAFCNCINLVGDLELWSSIYSIGSYSFSNCSSLQSLTIQNGYNLHIGEHAFDNSNFTYLDYQYAYVEPSYVDPIGLNANISIYVQRNYRSPSFCTYNIFYEDSDNSGFQEIQDSERVSCQQY